MLLGFGAVLVVCASGYLLWQAPGGRLVPVDGQLTAVGNQADLGSDPEVDARERATAGQTAADEVRTVDSEGAVVTILGRCVDSESGAPVAGVRVTLQAGAPVRRGVTPISDFEIPAPAHTGQDGRFRVEVPRTDWRCGLRLDSAGIVPASSGRKVLEEDLDFGDVQVVRGCLIRGLLVDESGNPVADRMVRIGRTLPWPDLRRVNVDPTAVSQLRFSSSSFPSTSTGIDGSFVLGPVPLGRWEVELGMPRRLARETVIELFPGQTEHWVELVAEDVTRSIRGRLVDERGLVPDPVAVQAVLRSGERRLPVVAADGTFVLEGFAWDVDGAAVEIITSSPFYEPFAEAFAWGATGVRVSMRALPVLPVRVTAAATGEPVQDFGLRVIPTPHPRVQETRPRATEQRPGGDVVCRGLQLGPHVVMVEPVDPAVAPSWFVPVEIAQVNKPLRIELARPVERQVVVREPTGEPVADARVQLVRAIDGRPITWTTPLLKREKMRGWEVNKAFLLQEARTDGRGRVTLRAEPGTEYAVRVFMWSRAPVVVAEVEMASGLGPLRVELN